MALVRLNRKPCVRMFVVVDIVPGHAGSMGNYTGNGDGVLNHTL